eukprot:scaffold3386_cov128-Skeletonema_menzelii.AAC.3
MAISISHPTSHQSEEHESELAAPRFETLLVDHNRNRGASESNVDYHDHCPNTLALARPTSFRSPSNHGHGDDEEGDDDDEEAVAAAATAGAVEDDDDERASSPRTFTSHRFQQPKSLPPSWYILLSLVLILSVITLIVGYKYRQQQEQIVALKNELAALPKDEDVVPSEVVKEKKLKGKVRKDKCVSSTSSEPSASSIPSTSPSTSSKPSSNPSLLPSQSQAPSASDVCTPLPFEGIVIDSEVGRIVDITAATLVTQCPDSSSYSYFSSEITSFSSIGQWNAEKGISIKIENDSVYDTTTQGPAAVLEVGKNSKQVVVRDQTFDANALPLSLLGAILSTSSSKTTFCRSKFAGTETSSAGVESSGPLLNIVNSTLDGRPEDSTGLLVTGGQSVIVGESTIIRGKTSDLVINDGTLDIHQGICKRVLVIGGTANVYGGDWTAYITNGSLNVYVKDPDLKDELCDGSAFSTSRVVAQSLDKVIYKACPLDYQAPTFPECE